MFDPRDVVRGIPLCLEAIGCTAFVLHADGAAVVAHCAAAAAAGLISPRSLPSGPQRRAAIAAALIVFALPLVGAALLAAVLWPSWLRGRALGVDGMIEIALPGASDEEEAGALPMVLGRPIREVLDDARAGADRMQAVIALRTMDARRAVPLLRRAFTHPSEEVRLLAFAILEGREKRLRTGIRSLEQRLAALGPDAEAARATCHRRLAQHLWELAYGGFVSGDLESRVLERAAEHATLGMKQGDDIASSLLLARIHLRQRRAAEAWRHLERAERAGAPRGSSAPLFAEAAYALGRYSEIPDLLARAEPGSLRRPELLPVAQFWTEPRGI